jgi:Zn-dependent protease
MEKTELKDILISWLALSLAFMFLFEGVGIPSVGALLVYLFIVAVSFLSHEFGHRQVARKYGLQANYEMWTPGIILAVVSSLFGFLIAAPGAVVIRQRRIFSGSREKLRNISLKISIAGVTVNIVLGLFLLIAYFFTGNGILYLTAYINIWLAIFNLLPIPPLDGSKVFHYNRKIWVLVFLVAIGLFGAIIFL